MVPVYLIALPLFYVCFIMTYRNYFGETTGDNNYGDGRVGGLAER